MPNRRERASRRQLAGRRYSRRHVVWLILLAAVVGLAWFGRAGYSLWAKRVAAERLRVGAISDARQYLMRAAWGAPDDGEIDLMLAFTFRQSRQIDRWRESLRAAARKGVSPARIEREVQLYRIQTGDWYEGVESQLAAFSGRGITAYEVPVAFVSGCLASNRKGLAKQLLDAWNVDSPNDAHVAHMMGKYWESLGDTKQARAHYQTALDLESRHELTHVALAEMFENNDQLEQGLQQYAALGSASPTSQVAALGAARILRKMVHLDRAQAILEPFAQTAEPPVDVAIEMGRIAMERDDIPSAERWFERAGVERARDPRVLMSVVRFLGMQGKAPEAERFFTRMATVGSRVTRAYDLRTRLALDPGDAEAAAELEQLFQTLDVKPTPLETVPTETAAQDENASPSHSLFLLHCGACHGPEGDGNGSAARHLFPPPRDLRREPSRLVSTKNGVPTVDDTIAVLRRGIPGTSMASYDELDDDQLLLLTEEAHRLRREGLREKFVHLLELEGEEADEREVEATVNRLASPSELFVVPAIGPSKPSSVARGKEIYQELGCATCHGEDGAGVAEQIWHDERGFPVRTRDLGRELLKGGQDAASIYLRIAAGMPGTPHPSSRALSQEQLIDLVQFGLSLSREPKLVLTDHQRAALAASRDYLSSLEAVP